MFKNIIDSIKSEHDNNKFVKEKFGEYNNKFVKEKLGEYNKILEDRSNKILTNLYDDELSLYKYTVKTEDEYEEGFVLGEDETSALNSIVWVDNLDDVELTYIMETESLRMLLEYKNVDYIQETYE